MNNSVMYITDAIHTKSLYGKKYLELVSHADNTTYVHVHHIVPVAFYSDVLHIPACRKPDSVDMNPANLVALSRGHHLLAHYYLMKCAKPCISIQMANAFKFIYNATDVTQITEIDVIRRMKEIDTEYNLTFKRVKQYTINGEFIAEFGSAKEAAFSVGSIHEHPIAQVCRGDKPTAYGYVWSYEDAEYSSIHFPGIHGDRKKRFKVSQYTVNGVLIKTHESVAAAARAAHCNTNNIWQVLNGVTTTAKGYVWAFSDTNIADIVFPGESYTDPHAEKAIKQYTTTGEYVATYQNIKIAGKTLNISDSNIVCNLNGTIKSTHGFVFALASTKYDDIKFPGVSYVPHDCSKHPVNKYTLTGKYLDSFESVQDAVIKEGVSHTGLRKACKQRTAYYGFLWRYANSVNGIDNITPDCNAKVLHYKVDILQYSTSGQLINSYANCASAAKEVGCTAKSINTACLKNEQGGQCRTVHGFVWVFKTTDISKIQFGVFYQKKIYTAA